MGSPHELTTNVEHFQTIQQEILRYKYLAFNEQRSRLGSISLD
ncbi:MAG: hypothetical protein ACI8ZN_001709, partial [Bacteroidia bacterium]